MIQGKMSTPTTSSAGSGLPSIEKLQGSSNFDTWKFDVECILVHDDLWQYVESPPASGEDAAIKRGDQRARTKICLLIENHCKVHVRKAKTAFETWNNLKAAYEDKGINNRCRLLSRLVSLKLSMFNSITEYVTELMRVANQLSDLGKEIDDELLAALMLQGLPEEYVPLRLALESTNSALTTEYIKTKLLQLDGDKLCTSTSASNQSSSALVAKPKHTKQNIQRNNDRKKTEKTIKCFICEGPHKACDCPDNPRHTRKVHMATALGTKHEEEPARDNSWILDSGASEHMSCRKDWMHDIVKVNRKIEVSCANGGKVYGEGYGMVASEMLDITVDDVMYVPGLSTNLLSISKITNKNKIAVFTDKECKIYNSSDCKIEGKPIIKGEVDRGVYKIKSSSQARVFVSTAADGDMELWHKRLAHLGMNNLSLLSDKMATGVQPHGTVNNMIAPLSSQSITLAKATVTGAIRPVILCKDKDGKCGVRLHSVNNGVFVCYVAANSPAALAGLRFGDQILEINNVALAGMSMDQCHGLLKKSPANGISMAVRDRPFERTITLHKDSLGHVGFQFKDGKIVGLVKDSSAARNGLLTDHQILEINTINVVGMKDKEISRVIEASPSVVNITIIPSYIYQHMISKMSSSLFKELDRTPAV